MMTSPTVCLETAQITPTSGGDVNESESLVQSSTNIYTAGQLDYIQNGEMLLKLILVMEKKIA